MCCAFDLLYWSFRYTMSFIQLIPFQPVPLAVQSITDGLQNNVTGAGSTHSASRTRLAAAAKHAGYIMERILSPGPVGIGTATTYLAIFSFGPLMKVGILFEPLRASLHIQWPCHTIGCPSKHPWCSWVNQQQQTIQGQSRS
eukprot:GHRR01023461.1.p1 GENE.GHRR01023461.1~~GHRR01023461.1.p1  ORF type:complete len:142 (-),score=10.62 GHRR01023461.1:417-842(-)